MKAQTLQQFHWNLAKFDLRYFLSTRFLGYPFELKTWLNQCFTTEKKPEKKMVIFSTGRSGSTLLVELLNSFPSVFCDTELLKRRLVDPLKLIDARARQSHQDIYGFKLLSYQLRDIQSSIHNKSNFLKCLHINGYQPIYLYRENKLQQAISSILAMTQSRWHSTQIRNSDASITIDINVLANTIKEMESLAQYERNLLKNIPHLSLSYEQDLEQAEALHFTMQKLSDYLGQPFIEPNITLKKLHRGHFSDYIHNWEEVLQFIEDSKFSKYLEATTMK